MKLTKTGVSKTGLVIATALMFTGLLQYGQAETEQEKGFKSNLQRKENASGDNHVPVKIMKIGGTATLGGTVIPFQEVSLAAQMPGRVEYIAGFEGEWFKKGAELIRIDDDDLLAQQRAAFAELENAHLAARNAGVQYNRELWSPQSKNINRMPGMGLPAMFDSMFTQNFGSFGGNYDPDVQRYSDLYAQGTQLNQTRSRIEQAQSRLDELAAKLRDTRSVAPFDGVIARKLVEVGDTVQPGQHLLVFSNLEYLQVKVDVPSRLMTGLQDTKYVTVRLDDPAKSVVRGRIAQKYPVADSERHTVTVKIDLKKNDPAIPGMYAEVIIPEPDSKKEEHIVIPTKAVISRQRGSLPAVYVWNPEKQRKERRYVRLGTQVDSDYVAVLSGLNKSDTLVIEDWR
jgi:multidrug efflux pump subunit AcrA (membrane-fusion protein)